MRNITFRSVGFTNVHEVTGHAQQTSRSVGNRHERVEPVKVYPTRNRAYAYAMNGYLPAEVFVKEAA